MSIYFFPLAKRKNNFFQAIFPAFTWNSWCGKSAVVYEVPNCFLFEKTPYFCHFQTDVWGCEAVVFSLVSSGINLWSTLTRRTRLKLRSRQCNVSLLYSTKCIVTWEKWKEAGYEPNPASKQGREHENNDPFFAVLFDQIPPKCRVLSVDVFCSHMRTLQWDIDSSAEAFWLIIGMRTQFSVHIYFHSLPPSVPCSIATSLSRKR